MALTPGSRLGHYEIVASLGAGGMGEVYRARDHHLGREVAIKVLPSDLLDTADRTARFEREARVLASLNHPHIAQVHGFDRADGVRYLVLELVEGRTLEEIIAGATGATGAAGATGATRAAGAGGAARIGIDEALVIARQIADALEAAHASGIVHRDLKPANIKVRPDGVVKVLDFGLAKALGDDGGADMANSPTVAGGATRDGVILGTAAYMSPEQARGRSVDKRTDIWAFGCVLYEMLTGRQAFGGETVSDAIAHVLGRDVDWTMLPAATPLGVRRLLRRCLERDARRRLHDVADARLDLDDADGPGSVQPASTAGPLRPVAWVAAPWIIVALLAAALVASLWAKRSAGSSAPSPQVVRFAVGPPDNTVLNTAIPAVAISPDGRTLAFSARSNPAELGSSQLYLRHLGEREARVIPGTSNGERPVFSPDGRSVAFINGLTPEIRRIAIDGGTPQLVCKLDSVNVLGMSWGDDDSILFGYRGPIGQTVLRRVAASGGVPAIAAAPDQQKGETGLSWPDRLPDGDHVLVHVASLGTAVPVNAVDVVSLKTGERKELLTDAFFPRYISTGHLLFERGGNLFGQRFDVRSLRLVGDPVVVQGMRGLPGGSNGGMHFALASRADAMVYLALDATGVPNNLVWVDREGALTAPRVPSRIYRQPSLSPDGHRLAFGVGSPQPDERDVWIHDLERDVSSRLTTSPEEDETPRWSPDGTRIAFAGNRDGRRHLLLMPSNGSGPEQRLWTTDNHFHVDAWSSDGRSILLNIRRQETGEDLSVYAFDTKSVTPFLQTPANEYGAAVSPDNRSVAYVSEESGRPEVYIRPFAGPGGAVQISRDGGSEPAWAHSGREVFFRDAGVSQLMKVDVAPGDTLRVGSPTMLVKVPFSPGGRDTAYVVSPNDKRFLGIRAEPTQTTSEIQVTLNWFEELKRLLPEQQ